MTKIKLLLQRDLYAFSKHPISYVLLFFIWGFTSYYFFILGDFFTITKPLADIRFFFSIFPLASIIIFPILSIVFLKNDLSYIDFIPLSSIQFFLLKIMSMSITFLFLCFSTLPIYFSSFFIAQPDFSAFFSACIGIILFTLVISTWSLFCSVVFSSSAITFLINIVGLLFFTTIHLVSNFLPTNPILTTIFRFFSLSVRFEQASNGLLTFPDIGFMLLLIALFMGLTWFLYERQKFGTTKNYSLYKIITAFIFCITSMFIFTRSLPFSIDMSANKIFTLSPYSKKIIQNLQDNLTIHYYASSELYTLYPHIKTISDMLYQYEKLSPHISVFIEDPQKTGADKILSENGIISRQIETTKDNKQTFVHVFSAIILEYAGQTAIIPFILDHASLEYDIAVRLKTITGKRPPSVFIVMGNALNLQNDYPYLLAWLDQNGMIIRELSLLELRSIQRLDTQTPFLILGSDKLTTEDVFAIEQLMQGGANFFFAVSPITIDINGDWHGEYTGKDMLIPYLEHLGISISPNILYDEGQPIRLIAQNTGNFELVKYPLFTKMQNNGIIFPTKGFESLSAFWASPITISNTLAPFLLIQGKVIAREYKGILKNNQSLEQEFNTNPFVIRDLNTQITNNKAKPQTVFIGIEKNNNRFVVLSSSYTASKIIEYTDSANNLDLFTNSILWLNYEDSLLTIKNKSFNTTIRYKNAEKFSVNHKKIYPYLASIFIVALLLLILYGTIISKRIKRA